jgi:hypothetical protein
VGSGRRKWDFDSGGVPSEFTQLTADDGVISVSDNQLRLEVTSATSGADTAGILIPFDRSIARYQRWIVCTKMTVIASVPRMAGPHIEYIPASPGTPPNLAGWTARRLCGFYTFRSGSTNSTQIMYRNTSDVDQTWLNSTKAWSATAGASTPTSQQTNDYEIHVIDWDEANARVRMAVFGGSSGSSLAANNANWRLSALSDWVNLSAVDNGSQTALYLSVGIVFTEAAWVAGAQLVEWIEHEWSDDLHFNSANFKSHANGTGYDRRAFVGLRMDTNFWLPVSRTGTIVAPVASTWESDRAGQWASFTWSHLIQKYVMAYTGRDTTYRTGIATATDPFGSWTKYASNPVLPFDSGQEYAQKLHPTCVEDWTEPDPAKRCKLIVQVFGSDQIKRTYLYTAATWETTAWTREGELLGADALDGAGGPGLDGGAFVYDGRNWHLFYVGLDPSASLNYRAYGPRLAVGAFTRDRSINYIPGPDPAGVEMAVSSGSSTSPTVTVDDTTGVQRDDWVCYDNDANTSNWRLGRVRKVISGTQLELYSLMPGLTGSGVLRTIVLGKGNPNIIIPFGDQWLWHGVKFAPMWLHATFDSSYEGCARWLGSRLLEAPTIDRLGTPAIYLADESNMTGSGENPATIRQPVTSLIPAARARQRRSAPHVRR